MYHVFLDCLTFSRSRVSKVPVVALFSVLAPQEGGSGKWLKCQGLQVFASF